MRRSMSTVYNASCRLFGHVRVAPRIVRIYTLRGFESPRLDHRALGQDRTVLRGVRERPDHRVCRTQASGRPWAEESLLPSDPRARPRLQDRVHPRLPEPAGVSHADPTRAPQGRTATRPRPVRPLRPDWADWISATSNAKPARRAACFSSSQLSSVGRFGRSIVF